MPDPTLLHDLKFEVARENAVFVAGTGVSVAASGNPDDPAIEVSDNDSFILQPQGFRVQPQRS